MPQTRQLNSCAQTVATEVLSKSGYPTSQIPNIRIHNGLDSSANILTRQAFPSAGAVTQGTNIYMRPGQTSRTLFEEVAHTAQFEQMGTVGFYAAYAALAVTAANNGQDMYSNNGIETDAKRLATAMNTEYRAKCSK